MASYLDSHHHYTRLFHFFIPTFHRVLAFAKSSTVSISMKNSSKCEGWSTISLEISFKGIFGIAIYSASLDEILYRCTSPHHSDWRVRQTFAHLSASSASGHHFAFCQRTQWGIVDTSGGSTEEGQVSVKHQSREVENKEKYLVSVSRETQKVHHILPGFSVLYGKLEVSLVYKYNGILQFGALNGAIFEWFTKRRRR